MFNPGRNWAFLSSDSRTIFYQRVYMPSRPAIFSRLVGYKIPRILYETVSLEIYVCPPRVSVRVDAGVRLKGWQQIQSRAGQRILRDHGVCGHACSDSRDIGPIVFLPGQYGLILVFAYERTRSSEAESVLAENVIHHVAERDFFLLGHVVQTLAPFFCQGDFYLPVLDQNPLRVLP